MSILMSHMMVTKNPQYVHRKCFWTILVTFMFDVKIDINMCEPHYVNYFFFVNLLHSLCVWLFDIWHLFDNLISFWHLDSFLTTWHLFWHMGNGKCGQMGIMVNTEDTDGKPWGMGHMGDGAMGHMVNVVMCFIMCNFLNTWHFDIF